MFFGTVPIYSAGLFGVARLFGYLVIWMIGLFDCCKLFSVNCLLHTGSRL